MSFYTAQGPIEDWNDYCREQEQLRLEYENRYPDFKCSSCDRHFWANEGGLRCHEQPDEVYCPTCVKFSNHIAYIRDYTQHCLEGQDPIKVANFIIENLKPI